MCMRYEQNIKMKENAAGSALLSKKISDLEAKVRVIVGELEERDENTKVSELSQKIISFFGNKLENIKNNTQSLLQNSFCKISELQN